MEQIAFYYNDKSHRGILTGIANGSDLVEITDEGLLQLIGKENNQENSQVVEDFIESILKKSGLDNKDKNVPCTWIIVPLAELDSGFGTLHLHGMGGIQGGDE